MPEGYTADEWRYKYTKEKLAREGNPINRLQQQLFELLGGARGNLSQLLQSDFGLTEQEQGRQFQTASNRLAPVFAQQRSGLDDMMASRGLWNSGIALRGQQNIGRQQGETLGGISSDIAQTSILARQQGKVAGQGLLQQLLGTTAGIYGGESQRALDLFLGELRQKTQRRGQDVQSSGQWLDFFSDLIPSINIGVGG